MNVKRESRAKKRAVSGVLSGLLLFSMLFSVGTGFFLFVSSGESQYSHALSNRATNLQSQLAESLAIAPTLGANNHLVFTATNSGGLAANMTDVFVVDPGGVTHTYGVGFGSNTTPALPGGVTPQKTSVSYDTGLTVVAGTYAIKVITHRGNAFTATYPPAPTNYASSAGSDQLRLLDGFPHRRPLLLQMGPADRDQLDNTGELRRELQRRPLRS